MDNNYDNDSNNEVKNTEENTPDVNAVSSEQPVYSDPNAGAGTVNQSSSAADNQSGYSYNQTDDSNSSGYTYGQDSSSEQNSNYQGYWDNQGQDTAPYGQNAQYNQNTQYGQNAQYNQNGQYSSGGQDNYNYNVNPSPSYGGEEGYDNKPMTMGDWVLVLLASFIPCCGGIILYFVWAFSKKGNINRRNYCRAALIIQGAMLALGLILWLIMGSAILSSMNYYY